MAYIVAELQEREAPTFSCPGWCTMLTWPIPLQEVACPLAILRHPSEAAMYLIAYQKLHQSYFKQYAILSFALCIVA